MQANADEGRVLPSLTTRRAVRTLHALAAAGALPPREAVVAGARAVPAGDGGRAFRVTAGGLRVVSKRDPRGHELAVVAALGDAARPAGTPDPVHVAGMTLLPDLGTVTAREAWERGGPRTPWAAALGTALGRLHGVGAAGDLPAAAVPWALALEEGDPGASAATRTLARIADQTPSLRTGLGGLRDRWSAQTPVHGDVRLDNVVLTGDGAAWLVDWETGGGGDPGWDTGSLLAALFAPWAAAGGGGRARPLLTRARYAATVFVGAYDAVRPVDPGARRRRWVHAAGHAGARFVQDAIESAQWHDAPDAGCLRSMRLAANVLRDPPAALRDLFAVPV